MSRVALIVLVLVVLPFVCGDNEWDFIIVGAGEAGSVVAARLANETNQEILLLEGGALGTGQRDIGGIDFVASTFKTNPATGKQVLAEPLTRYDVPLMADSIRIASDVLNNIWPINAKGPFFSQAKVIGGNQATNGLNWALPQLYDLDNWGIPDYSSANFWPYIRRTENATETGYGNTPTRGNAGRTNIKFSSFVQLEQYRFQNACLTAGYKQGGDVNDGILEQGIYLNQNNIKQGVRSATAVGYLAPVLKKFPINLTFRTSAVVTRVLFDSSNKAIGVEYLDETCNETKTAYARKEVILTAGDLQVSKILYNSGIGPKSILQAYGKPLRVVNEVIGQKIRNHQRVPIVYSDRTLINANFYNYPSSSVQYARTGTGPIEGRAFIFLSFNSNYSKTPYPDIQASFGLVAGATPTSVYNQGFAVTVGLTQNVYANATVNLTSSDPLAATNFTANTFLVQADAERIARGILEVRRVMKYWNGSAVELAPGPTYDTIPKLVDYIRANPGTTCHYYGSTPMGTSSSAPTDTKMRVRGVTGLRIVGPSVIPGPVFPGMQALANALAEKGTDLIKVEYNL